MTRFTKATLALALFGSAMSASATQFYIDTAGTGVGVAGSFDPTVCATCSSLKDEATFRYESITTITLDDANLVGDAITTIGGLAAGVYGNNLITGFIPGGSSAGLVGDQGLINLGVGLWGLSFSFELFGEVSAATGLLVEEVSYDSGLIEVFAMLDNGLGGLNQVNIFDMTVTGSDNSNPSNFLILGNISLSGNEDPLFADFFNLSGVACEGESSFSALVSCVPPIEIAWVIDQNLNDETATLNGDGTATVTGNHDGSIVFNVVPAPAPILLIGAALLGLVGMRRKLG